MTYIMKSLVPHLSSDSSWKAVETRQIPIQSQLTSFCRLLRNYVNKKLRNV